MSEAHTRFFGRFEMAVLRWHAALTLLSLLLALCPRAFALDPSLDISQYAHKAWTIRDGFFNGTIYSIAQTPDGYLWLGTELGYFRFDGVRVQPWRQPSGQELSNSHKLLAARDGTLWMGTFAGVSTWDGTRLTRFPQLGPAVVTALLEDREGTVWAGAWGTPKGRLCAFRSGKAQCYGEDGAFGSYVSALYEDSSGAVWATGQTGLWRLKPGPPRRCAIPPAQITAMSSADDGRLLMAMYGAGLMQLAGDRIESYPVRNPIDAKRSLAERDVHSNRLLRDRDGGLWIGTVERGLIHVHHGRTDVFTRSDGLSGNVIFNLFEDREGNIWVATAGGLDRFRENPVTTVSASQGLSSDATESVLAATDGSIWVGTHEGLTRWKNGQTNIFLKADGLPDDTVQSQFQDDHGQIWVSTPHGLAYFQGGRFVASDSARGRQVFGIAGGRDGGLWLSEEQGILHLVRGRALEHVTWAGLGCLRCAENHQTASVLLSDHDQGGLWLGFWGGGGLSHFKDGRIRVSYTAANGLGAGNVRGLQLDRDQALWAATDGGLSRIQEGRITTLTRRNGLPCDTVFWSIEDDDRSLWLFAACGLVRIRRSELDAWIADPKRQIKASVWDATDGVRLRSSLAGTYPPRVTKSTDGKLWFTTGEDIQVVNPRHLALNEQPPPVHIEQVVADNKSYVAAPGLRLPSRVHYLAIDYTALSLTIPEKVRFRYKLEGVDKNWREVVNDREVQYTNLPPRHYRFRVLAANNSGVWNEVGDSLDFDIPPAWYQTMWFRAACVAAFLALLWAVYLLRVHQLQEQEAKFRDAVETMPALAFVAEPGGNRTFVNRGWLDYTGFSLEQASGSGWEKEVHPDDLKRVVDRWRASETIGQPLEYEARMRRGSDGAWRWFQTRARPLRDKRGKIVKWCAVATDIEDRKRYEQLQSELAHVNRISTLGELAASISHELKQPITASKIYASAGLRWLNRDEPDLQQVTAVLERILENGNRATEIMDHLRSLYKKAPSKRKLLDVNEVIGEMVVLLRSEAARHGVSVRADLAEHLPNVIADRVQIQQVLMNLMLNGIEAMSERGGVLTVKSQSKEDSQILISVDDTGPGLPPGKGDRIFDAFFTTKPQGSGMGLAISKSIVESHGGRIWANGNGGLGATFHFTLPPAPADSNHPNSA